MGICCGSKEVEKPSSNITQIPPTNNKDEHNTQKIRKYRPKEEFYGISKPRPEIKVDNKLLQSDYLLLH